MTQVLPFHRIPIKIKKEQQQRDNHNKVGNNNGNNSDSKDCCSTEFENVNPIERDDFKDYVSYRNNATV